VKIESIMTSKVVTVKMDDSLRHTRSLFNKYKFHHLLVVEGRKLVGIVSDRDLLRELSPFLGKISSQPRDLAIFNKRVHQIMSHKPITVKKEEEAKDSCRLLLEHNISCLPVIDSQGNVEGIVTWRDIFNVLLGEKK